MNPEVSIALCVHNGARYLGEQLDSVFAQHGVELEVLAIDDGSTDTSAEILAAYATRHPRLQFVRYEQNRGHAASIAEAFDHCTAPWIAPCDQDDLWHPLKLSHLLAHAKAHGADAAYADSALCDADGRDSGQRISDSRRMQEGHDPVRLFLKNSVSGHAMVFRRELLARAMPLPERVFYDHWLAMCAMAGQGLVYLHEPLVRFRRHAQAQTNIGLGRRGPAGSAWFDEIDGQLAAAARLPGAAAATAAALRAAITGFRGGDGPLAAARALWPCRKALPGPGRWALLDLLRFLHRLQRMRHRERGGR